VSAHREENVDNPERLTSLLTALHAVAERYDVPVLISTHPRTRKRLESQPDELKQGLTFHAPFGFHDYVRLQRSALIVLSDSGTISEESAILGFPAISLRDAIERPEAIDTGATITSGVGSDDILGAIDVTLSEFASDGAATAPWEYEVTDASRRTVNLIRSTAATHHRRAGIRRGAIDAG
jgi:UDP-N-acetyl-L-fucosamine synthase